MRVSFLENGDEYVYGFRCEDALSLPNVGDHVYINNKGYTVHGRVFNYSSDLDEDDLHVVFGVKRAKSF